MSTLNKQDIVLQDVSVTINEKTILNQLSLTFEAETIYTVIGSSGAGKTTLLNVLAGIQPFSSGVILKGGQPYQPEKQVTALVPQDYGLLPWENAWKAVSSAMLISSKQKKLTQEQINSMEYFFQAFGIAGIKDKYPHEISGGQKQRVSLARAFAIPSELILLDEPFAALDTLTRESLQKELVDSWEKKKKSALFITHDIQEALFLGQKIIVMGKNGQIRLVYENPFAHQFEISEALIQQIQKLRKEIEDEN